MNRAAETFRRRLLNPLALRAYLFAKLPLAWFAGLRVETLDAEECVVSVPFGWRTQNPFRSIYFAALAMAAELSTGAPAMMAVRESGEPMSMLVTGMRAEFGKKATERVRFRFGNAAGFREAVDRAAASGEGVELQAETVGRMSDGTEVARFTFTWSFKTRIARV